MSIACAEGTDGKLSMRKANMDLSVINRDECHGGNESGMVIEDYNM